jgi:hypothetical protein
MLTVSRRVLVSTVYWFDPYTPASPQLSQTWGCECNIVYYISVLFVYYYVFILSSLATH